MRQPFADSPEFRRLVGGVADVSLPRVALEIARDADPSIDIDMYLARIAELSDRVRLRCGPEAGPKRVIGQVNWVLFVEEGYKGNTTDYYDPRNSLLNQVIDRRTGIPITLSILFAAVARPLGLDLGGVALPGHYLLRLVGSDPPRFVDPFHDGAILDRTGCLARVSEVAGGPVVLTDPMLEPCSAGTTVARMLRNLLQIYLRNDDLPAALTIARRQGVLDPHDLDLQRHWGIIAYQTGHPGEAVGPLGRYLDGRPDAPDAGPLTQLLRTARREVAASN